MADGLVQHDAGPAGAEHHVHLAGWCRHRLEIDQSLTHGLVDRTLPGVRGDETFVALAAAEAERAGLLPVAVAGDDRDIEPHQRPDVAIGLAVGSKDLDHLPGRGDARGHLPHAGVLGAGIGIDLFQRLHLGVEGGSGEGVLVAIELAVGAAGRVGIGAGIAALDRAHRLGRARQRRFRHVGSVRIADRLALHGAQAEALRGVVGRLLQAPVVEDQRLRLLVFEEQFTVVGAFEAPAEQLANLALVEARAVDQGRNGWIHWMICSEEGALRPSDKTSVAIWRGRAPAQAAG